MCTSKMITLVLGGGLGNQMFQYAYLYSQLKKYKGNTKPLIKFVMHHNQNEDRRVFALKYMKLSLQYDVIDEAEEKLFYRICWFKEKLIKRICEKANICKEKEIALLRLFRIVSVSDIYAYYRTLIVDRGKFFVEGSFQSWKYFAEYREDIMKEFKVATPLSPKVEMMAQRLKKQNSVCVHIRRGDYVNSYYSGLMEICNYDYYKKGMEIIFQNVENPVFYIFSNTHKDHYWIKQNYQFSHEVEFVDMENVDYEELVLMQSCRHFIISNSSFSWWAQFLSDNTSKIVVAPSRWINSDVDVKDIYMDNWMVI